jgi:membrane protease YdiL (CAAX protease family)
MTSRARAGTTVESGARLPADVVIAAVAIAGVGGAAGLRWVLWRSHAPAGLDGVLFAMAVLGVAGAVRYVGLRLDVGTRPTTEGAQGAWGPIPAVALGLLGGAVLVAVPIVARVPGAPPLLPAPRPDASLGVWVGVTLLVAASEEVLFRGALFDALLARHSTFVSVALTSLLFALVHVPFYGPAAIPIDVAAGVWLAGLRLTSGRLVAPGIAHALADLVTWWL